MRKAWADMTPQERDALVAERVCGWYVDRGGESSPPLTDPPRRIIFNAEGDGYVARLPMPAYSTDPAAARLVEDAIYETQGIHLTYLRELTAILKDAGVNTNWDLAWGWGILRATPEQRCLAALRAAGVKV